MKRSTFKNIILALLICPVFAGCVSLQQPLPGILWGNWSFVKDGTITNDGHEELYNYNNVCDRESDLLHFTSDNKLTMRWYDRICHPHYYSIGRYHIEDKILKIDLANGRRNRDSPFPPITQFRIVQINETTLKLEEMPNNQRRDRGKKRRKHEALVFVFIKTD